MNTIAQAKKLLETGDIQQGRQMLLDITTADPVNASAWLLLCGVSTRTQDWTLGVHSFEHLVRLRPSSGLASSGLVQSYINLEKYEDAFKEIARFQSVADSDNNEAQIVLKEHQQIAERLRKSNI